MAKQKVRSGRTRAGATSSNEAANKRLIRRWFDQVWNKQRAEAIDAMFSAGGIAHGKGVDGRDVRGPAGFKPFHSAYLGAFPDLRIKVEEIIAEGSRLAVRWSVTGTHTGGGLGFAATGRAMRMDGMLFVAIRNGKIVEGRDCFDSFGMFQQLGVVTPPAASAAGARTAAAP